MCRLLLVFSFFFALPVFGQKEIKLKRKVLKNYQGEIPAYNAEIQGEIISIDGVSISIDLSKDNVDFQIGERRFSGKPKVLFKNKDFYLVEVQIEENKVLERLKVFPKEKKVVRLGFAEQPDAILPMKKNR